MPQKLIPFRQCFFTSSQLHTGNSSLILNCKEPVTIHAEIAQRLCICRNIALAIRQRRLNADINQMQHKLYFTMFLQVKKCE